ncbi:MAG: glycosyltransferase family 4 protein [Planctomycetota bacterium]|nr:glycosyltransferase family 4 protein [Planctomycetota bacterium]
MDSGADSNLARGGSRTREYSCDPRNSPDDRRGIPLKILILSDRFPPHHLGGAEVSTGVIAGGLAQAGCQVRVVTRAAERSEVGEEIWKGIRVRSFWDRYDERFRAYYTIYNRPALQMVRQELARFRPDVVQAHNVRNHISFSSLWAARRAGIPVVFTAHDPGAICQQKMICGIDLESLGQKTRYEARPGKCGPCMRFRYFPLRNFLIRRILEGPKSRVMAVSRELSKILETNGYRSVEVLPNGIDVEMYARVQEEEIQAFRAQHEIPPERLVIGGGGRLSFWKGFDHLVDAAAKLSGLGIEDFQIVLVGRRGGYEQSLLERARTLGIEDRILFVGWMDPEDLPVYYAACDVVTVPSIIPDSLPRTALEAMAAARPVLGSPFGGTPEIIVDGVTGRLANPLVPEEFANALAELLSDPVRGRSMGEAGRQRVLEHFSIESNVQRRLELYRSLGGARAPLQPASSGIR